MMGHLYLILCLVIFPAVALADERMLDCKGSVLIVVESPDVFHGSPCEQKLATVTYPSVGYVSGILGSDHVMSITKNAAGVWVIVELTLTGEVVYEYPKPLGAFPYTFSPDGRNFLYQDTHGKWILRNLVTATEETLFDPEKSEHLVKLVHPAFSPDGKTIAFSHVTYWGHFPEGGYDVTLCLVTVPQGFQPHDCLETEGKFPAFSPDGSKVAYWERTKEQSDLVWNLVIRNLGAIRQGGPAKTLATKHLQKPYLSLVGPIGWSPDSQWIVWSEKDDNFNPYHQLFRKHVEGSETYRIELKRPWWTTFLRKYALPEDKNRFLFSFYWAPVSKSADEK